MLTLEEHEHTILHYPFEKILSILNINMKNILK